MIDILSSKYRKISETNEEFDFLDYLSLRKNEERKEILEILEQTGKISNFETNLLNKNGFSISTNLNISLIQVKEQDYLLTICQDITKRKLKEEENQILINHQKAINDLAIAMGEVNDLTTIYRLIFKHLQSIMEAATLAISFYDKDKQIFTAGYVITDGAELDVSNFPPIPLNKEKGKGTQSQVIHTGKIFYADVFQKALDSSKTTYTYTKDGSVYKGRVSSDTDQEDIAKSSVYVPMKIPGEIIGVLNIQNFKIKAFKNIDLDLLTTFTNVASIGIQNIRLSQDKK